MGYPETMYKFAFLPGTHFKRMLSVLQKRAAPESWKYPEPDASKNVDNPVLENYLLYTYKRLALSEPEKIKISKSAACFNTGLFTLNYQSIHAYFSLNKNWEKKPSEHSQWFLSGFYTESLQQSRQSLF